MAKPSRGFTPTRPELRLVTERLLLSSLHAHEQIEQLRQQLELTGAIMNSLGDGLYAVDASGRMTFANLAVERLLGRSQADLLGEDAHALLHSHCVAQHCPLREVLHTGEPARQDDHLTGPEGRTYPVTYSASPIVVGAAVVGAVITFADISPRRQAEEALAAERTAVLSQLTEGIIIADPAGRIVFVNESARKLHGVATLNVAADGYSEAYHLLAVDGSPYPPHELPLARAVEHGETTFGARWRVRQPDGEDLVVEGSATPVIGSDGVQLGAALVLHDVTAQQLLERQKDDFFSAIAHDLQSPITVIKGNAQLLLRSIQRPSYDLARLVSLLERINTTSTEMELLVRDVLDLTHLQWGKSLFLRRQPTDLVALVRRIIADLESSSLEQRVRMVTTSSTLVGLWDPTRLERVLVNLLSNATKYSPDGGAIILDVQADGVTHAIVSVQDEGLGIPAADLPHIFERFQRGRNVVNRIPGTGIGLAGARQIVEQHGGTMQLESREGVGTTVTLRLPLAAAEAPGTLPDVKAE